MSGFKVPETPKTVAKKVPKQLMSMFEQQLGDGYHVQAVRTISMFIAGKYVPRRSFYATLWHFMLSASSASAANHCYEALKLAQGAWPPLASLESHWCPREERDYELLKQALEVTRPIEEDADDRSTPMERQFLQWRFCVTKHATACPISKQEEYSVVPLGQRDEESMTTPIRSRTGKKTDNSEEMIEDVVGANKRPRKRSKPVKSAKCQRFGCMVAEEDSKFFPLFLQFFVSMLTENARSLTPEQYGESAVSHLLIESGDLEKWKTVANILFEGIASLQLERNVSDTYFQLLHLLIDVCGNKADPDRESAVFVWLVTTGVPLMESCAENFNDSLAELLDRSKWWRMKLQFVNTLLLQRFDTKEVKQKTLLEEESNVSVVGERLVHVFFFVRPRNQKSQQTQDEGEDVIYDSETLVILVATAWQCACSMKEEWPELWNYLLSQKEVLENNFEMFMKKLARLSSLRGNEERTNLRSNMYCSLLGGVIQDICK